MNRIGHPTTACKTGVTSVLLAVMLCGLAIGAEVTPKRLNESRSEPHNWLSYYGSYDAWRYSELDQVSRDNVKKLIPVWTFQTGEIDGGLQSSPIVVDGVMYITGAWNRVFAIDAVTGKELWHYYHPRTEEIPGLYGTWNRGVAVGHGLVFMGTLDNKLVALDAESGREVWQVEIENAKQCGCNITGAPLLVKDKIVTGVTGGDSAHRGYISAFDAKTGRHAWRFWTIPGPGEPGNDTWKGDSWKFGGGSSWITGSYDPELDILYWGVGNPAADFYGESRKGDNLYTDSIVALDPDTGKLIWHYQEIPYDVWDWDSAYEIVLVDLEYGGEKRKLLVNPNKGGFTWVLDRTDGKFINAWPLADNIDWISGIDENGELLDRKEPKVGETIKMCPSIGGGRSWNHGAYSPKTGWFYTTGIEWCQEVLSRAEEPREGMTYFGGEFTLAHTDKGEPGGHLSAYDPITGEKHWRIRHKYPLLASQLATAGNLLFTGDATGKAFALDAETGKELWSFRTGSGIRSSPMTYAVNGRQYVAVPSGWGSALAGLITQLWPEAEDFPSGATLFVFALPE